MWVDTPTDVVVERDPKGLYAKAAAGTLPNMTGVGQGYEPPENPDLVVVGDGDVDDAVNAAARRARGRALTTVVRRRRAAG